MYIIIVLCALALLQLWGSRNPLHRDQYFCRWVDESLNLKWLKARPEIALVWSLGLPVFIVLTAQFWLPAWMWVIFAVAVLLYSLGRGEFAPHIEPYTMACTDNRWGDALSEARRQGIDVEDIRADDWPELHQKILGAAAYQGFERMFAVLFWFVVFGPAGALLYRLSFLYAKRVDQPVVAQWLWALEWLPVRALGASFALTGNFVGCINRWKTYLFCLKSGSAYLLSETVLGALSVDDELMQSCDCTQREIVALRSLYTRTLWMWVAIIAILSLVC